MNYIFYNGRSIPFPTPLVSLSQENISYNRDWASNAIINLEGQLTGDYENIRKSQSGLLNIFNKNFGNFQIYEATGSTGFYRNVTGDTSTISSLPGYYSGFSGAYIPKNSSVILRIDGNYGGYPISWQVSKDKVSWNTLPLIKTHYYSGFTSIFNPSNLYVQFFPYINVAVSQVPSQSNGGDQNNPSVNARGIYTGNMGDNNYFRISIDNNGGASPGDPRMNLIVSGFDADKIYEKSGIIIRSINFEESPYFGIVNYNIELNSFAASGNVLDPRNEFSFSEDEQKNLRLSHNISARGINTSSSSQSNALQNAINFVKSYTGLNNIPSVKFISGFNNRFYLQSFSESINRLNGIYSVQEEYISNLIHTGLSGSINYSVNVTSGAQDNSIQIDIRGNYKGSLYGDINILRNSLNAYNLVTGIYSGYINPIPIQYNITENTGENSISFDYSFDNINLPNPYYRYDGSVNLNELDQILNVQARGEMITRGNLKYRSSIIGANVEPLISGLNVFASGLASGFRFVNDINISRSLRVSNISITKDENEGILNADITYDDKYLPSGNFVDANYNININAPHWYMNNLPTCNVYGYHVINDFDITTLPSLTMNINCSAKDNESANESDLRAQILKISSGIQPTNYNYSEITSEDQIATKRISDLDSLYDISYNITKIAIDNQDGVLPKFNAIT